MAPVKPARQLIGSALVGLQLALIVTLAVSAGPAFLHGQAPAGAVLLAAAAVMFGIWALCANRPGNFKIRPTPRDGGRLVQEGPYRWIRHPMYTAVIACSLAAAWGGASPWGWLAATLLIVVLAIKALLEERWMLAVHPDYAAYRARTRRFIPGLL
jgi:protein-S-isoprenylcysteine O-methyltransferase Ste14